MAYEDYEQEINRIQQDLKVLQQKIKNAGEYDVDILDPLFDGVDIMVTKMVGADAHKIQREYQKILLDEL